VLGLHEWMNWWRIPGSNLVSGHAHHSVAQKDDGACPVLLLSRHSMRLREAIAACSTISSIVARFAAKVAVS
jgi:hypothetical protein